MARCVCAALRTGQCPRGNISSLFGGKGTTRAYSLGLTSTSGLRGDDVTIPESPVSLVGVNPAPIAVTDPAGSGVHRYLLALAEAIQPPAAMRLATELQAVSGADYVILSPAPFIPALTELIALGRARV